MKKCMLKKAGVPIFVLAVLLVLASAFSAFVQAASTAAVSATVTAQNISVTVSTGSVAFGTLAAGTSAGTNPSQTQTATNNGNITEQFNIQGANSTNWTLGATAGSEQYVLKFCTATCGTPPTNYTALTTSYQALGTNIAVSGTKTFDLYVTTPTSTASFGQQSTTVTIQATQ